VTSSFNLARI